MDIHQTIDGTDLVLRIPLSQIVDRAFEQPVTETRDPYWRLARSSREFLKELKSTFGNQWVNNGDPRLYEMEKKHFIRNFTQLIKQLMRKGFAEVEYRSNPESSSNYQMIKSFKLTF